ncbi:FG-GAP repeat domain protein [Verrucomicrobiia bacterium DG1235]|nr:FG-GAP repeat domain protein [Verrucomicrobiae bacterium DG1235]
MSPSDVSYKPYYERAITFAALDLQVWFASELEGASFSLAPNPVTWYQLPHDSEYYEQVPTRAEFRNAVATDSESLIHSSTSDPNDIWIIFVDSQSRTEYPIWYGSDGNRAILSLGKLHGISGEFSGPVVTDEEIDFFYITPSLYYEIGDLGRNIGSAFGLPAYDPHVNSTLMSSGAFDYPDTYLFNSHKSYLLSHAMISHDYGLANSSEPTSLIKNGGFEDGTNSWVFYTNGIGEANTVVPGYTSRNSLEISIQEDGTNTQFLQRGIHLEPKTDYLFAFSALSEIGYDLSVTLSNDSTPYVNYGINRKSTQFFLRDVWQTYLHGFTTKGFNSPVSDGKLFFWLIDGLYTDDTYRIDDVLLVPLTQGATERPDAPEALAVHHVSDTRVELTWKASNEDRVIGYFVYRDGEHISANSKDYYVNKYLDPLTEYSYYITAVNEMGYESDPSEVIYVKTRPSSNLIRNGGFDQFGEHWPIRDDQVFEDTEGVSYFPKWATICKSGVGGQMLLHQNEIELFPSTSYRLSLIARSTMGGDIEVTLHQGVDKKAIDLSAVWEKYDLYFTTPDFGMPLYKGFIHIAIGPDDRTAQCYEFDSIVLTQVEPANVGALDPPVSLTKSLCSESVVCLSWKAPASDPGELSYIVFKDGVQIGTTTSTKHVDYGLSLDQTYEYTVVAVDGIGRVSEASVVRRVTTPVEPINGVNLVRNGGFEEGMFRWNSEQLRAYASALEPMEGDSCGRAHFPLTPMKASLWQGNVVLEPETKYLLSFFARSNRAKNDEILLDVTAPGGVIAEVPYVPFSFGLEEYSVEVGTNWRIYCIEFETPPSFFTSERTTLSFGFKDHSGLRGSYSLDKIALVKKGGVEALMKLSDGTVAYEQKISQTEGGFGGLLNLVDLFGFEVDDLGDVNGDGVTDLAVGTFDDDGGFNTGAVWILFMNEDGTVAAEQKISDTQGEFTGDLNTNALFGSALCGIGDLNGDGIPDLAVGNYGDNDGGNDRGAVWILFLNSDGTVGNHQKISQTRGGFTAPLLNDDQFGSAVANIGDLDGDGVTDIAVGSWHDDDGGSNKGAVWILNLNADGTVKDYQKISSLSGGFNGALDNEDQFGSALARLDDLNGDGVDELIVSAAYDDDAGENFGALWILYMNPDGTVKDQSKISAFEGGFTGPLVGSNSLFGFGVDGVADLNGDGTPEIVVGVRGDPGGGHMRGAIWTLFLNPNGTVASEQKVTTSTGGFGGMLMDEDLFGTSVSTVSDLNGDGVPEYAVGASSADDGGNAKGSVWILFLNKI